MAPRGDGPSWPCLQAVSDPTSPPAPICYDPRQPLEPVDQFPEIFFLPLAVAEPDAFEVHDPGVLARRIPDFVQQLVNQGQPGPAAMLEVQSGESPVQWELLREPPDADQAFRLVPAEEAVRVVVFGTLAAEKGGYRVELTAVHGEDMEVGLATRFDVFVRAERPVGDLCALARRLARHLHLAEPQPSEGLLTESGPAFFRFLVALDSAALLSGDLAIEVEARDRPRLLQPFYEALSLDPGFGLALRLAQVTVGQAWDEGCLEAQHCIRFLDDCLALDPADGEGCVGVADLLVSHEHEAAAQRWYSRAVAQDPPSSRGLENLGILLANRGETEEARRLWVRGMELDGHPDFCGHLARLAFAEDEGVDAWQLIQRGLRRIHERSSRFGEWEEDGRGSGVLLRYLVEHMADHPPPEDVVAGLYELCGVLHDDEDRVELGLCLLAAGDPREARAELIAGRDGIVHPDVRDRAQRALLGLDLTDFEPRFSRAAEWATSGRNGNACLAEFELYLQLQPEFWPALYFSALARREQGEQDLALDLLAEALRIRPEQPDVLAVMGELFAERGNHKRAAECASEALLVRPDDVDLLCLRARQWLDLGRGDEARDDWDRALDLSGPEGPRNAWAKGLARDLR